MTRLALIGIAAFLGLAGCANTPAETPPEPIDLACYPLDFRFAYVELDTEIHRQGSTVAVSPRADVSPGGTVALPHRCTDEWTLAGPAAFNPERTAFTIDEDAAADSEIVVSFTHGSRRIERRVRVVARDAIVLTGRWSQKSIEGCPESEPVRELEFSADGRFSVTFRPFESYRDYWGAFSFDSGTGRLRLDAEGGANIPASLDLEGTAARKDDRLVLTGFYLGDPENRLAASDCIYVF